MSQPRVKKKNIKKNPITLINALPTPNKRQILLINAPPNPDLCQMVSNKRPSHPGFTPTDFPISASSERIHNKYQHRIFSVLSVHTGAQFTSSVQCLQINLVHSFSGSCVSSGFSAVFLVFLVPPVTRPENGK